MLQKLFYILLSSKLSKLLQDIEKGNHDDKECDRYCKTYKDNFDQELPDCEFKGDKSKIQNLVKKIHIDIDGNMTEVQFVNLSDEPKKAEKEKKKCFIC